MALLDVLTRPPQVSRAVERPRLRALLAEGDEPACLLVAPPGSGKTVAAAQLVAHAAGGAGVRVGWCRFTAAMAGGDDLVRLVAAALGPDATEAGGPPVTPVTPLERAAALLDALGDGPVVLVIDDYDLARPEECDAVLAEVVALAPPQCRIVVCSSTRPAGLLGRASVGQVRVVGTDELAFTEDEVRALLERLGRDPGLTADLHTASAGWATAVTVLAESAGPGAGDADLATAIDVVLDRAGLVPGHDGDGASGGDADPDAAGDDFLAIVSLAPAIGSPALTALGLEPRRLVEMATTSAILRPVGDRWALLDVVRTRLQQRLGPERLRVAAGRLAPVLATTDPVAAADVLMQAGDPVGAADVLARRASAVSPEAALPLLYRMPADVRRRLPPLLSAARATVEMDSALTSAEQRLASASDDSARLEAQVAVATILLHRGQLASAAAALESVVRAASARHAMPAAGPPAAEPVARGIAEASRFALGQGPAPSSNTPSVISTTIDADPLTVAATARGWLALARFLAGDIEGATAVVAGMPGGDIGDIADAGGPALLVWWVAAEIGLARDDAALVGRAVERLRRAGWLAAAEAAAAQQALAEDDQDHASAAAAAAYRVAAEHGGIDLLVAAPPHAWCLARAGRWDEAAAVADELRRRLGNVDTAARLHADLILQARATYEDDAVTEARVSRAIATTRRLGYAPVEAAARRWLPAAPPAHPSATHGRDAPSLHLAPATEPPRPPGSGPVVSGAVAGPWGSSSGLEVGVLGAVVIRVDGRVVPDGAWRSRKAREVLLVLALAGDVGASRDEVIEAVWPERDPVKGRTLLRTALTEVRQVLEPRRPPGEPSRFVTTRADRVAVQASTDLAEARRRHDQARSDPAAGATGDDGGGGEMALLTAAWALFRGPFAADEPYTASLDEARRQAERLQLDVADALVTAAVGTGRQEVPTDLLVDVAAHVVGVEPWRTDVVEAVTAACRAAGDENQARRAERLLRP